MEYEKQHQCINNFCLCCGEQGHVFHKCPKKHGPHVTRAISITNP